MLKWSALGMVSCAIGAPNRAKILPPVDCTMPS